VIVVIEIREGKMSKRDEQQKRFLIEAARRVIRGIETQNLDHLQFSKAAPRSIITAGTQEEQQEIANEFWLRLVKELKMAITLVINNQVGQ
jgi:hypothetical protein